MSSQHWICTRANSIKGTPIPFNWNKIINLQIISIINCNLYVLKIYFIKNKRFNIPRKPKRIINEPTMNTISQEKNKMTIVLIAVAKLESVFLFLS